MTNFIVYVEQLEYEEYEVVVEAKSIKSVKEEWEGISNVVDEYCYNDATEYLDDDGTIFRTEIKLVLGTQERKKLWVDDYEVVSVVKVDEGEYDHE
ncbi:MAG TPA: hypothetical protein EYM57_01450 [Gammaproteobacteria bacterium]|jgi:hypothetical protein|nr:hypothetical protein [Gammaproteobacteria bacterium]HIM96555.1 hypothetical protein [Gammaproteobacteria bacterium]HIN42777.1 hypothetical protein [Gammaproteobacteria bacterium]HIO01758.1 hypothetical protein [Alphaproteobacteria bacterium]HIP05962.1 hypothetical protein [Gammaproteobacteria bacterium]|tara:strand:- start:305 stop:592 length:288 start_codon:yes stop_codon:yes gene_type:complete